MTAIQAHKKMLGGPCLNVVVYEMSDHVGNVLVYEDDGYVISVGEVLEGILYLLDSCLCRMSRAFK